MYFQKKCSQMCILFAHTCHMFCLVPNFERKTKSDSIYFKCIGACTGHGKNAKHS